MYLKDLLEFLRFKISFFAAFSATTGYLLFNPLSLNTLLAGSSAFFLCAAVSAYNDLTDVKEDLINRKKINPFVYNIKGKLLIGGCILLGLVTSFLLSLFSVAFYVLPLIIFLFYSSFRIKRYPLIKNIYTALGSSLVFFIGTGKMTESALIYYLFVAGFVFIGSVLSDLRDLEGDKMSGIRTLPVVIGEDATKKLLYLWICLFSMFLLILKLHAFFLFLPFAFLISFFLSKNEIITAHILIGPPFVFTSLWLMISQILMN